MSLRFVPLLGFLLVVLGPLCAQGPQVAPTRLGADESISIDGDLTEPIWSRAASITDFTQVQPTEGATPSRHTEVLLAYDKDYVYVGLRCHDDPDQVRARLMNRDANLDPDDRVEMWFDTYDTQRFAYWFQIGAAGSRGDALLSGGGTRFNKRWDGIWFGQSRLTGSGWQAEVALPFKTLAFEPESTEWGFNVRRFRKAIGEEVRWANPLVAYRFFNLAVGGKLTGLEGMHQGVGLDVVPYVKFNAGRDREVDKHTSRTGDAGLDLRYNITPSLQMLLTYNTDFAETEVDERQVNLSRFPLFFPEKRDFFLQDAGLFAFGRSSGGGGQTLPFFSRRIGLDDGGNPVPILGGAKLTGRAGPWNLGVLGTVIDETAVDQEKGLGVARISRNFGAESQFGVIATGGRPVGSGDAATYGADLRLSDSRFFGEGRSARLWAYWMQTQNEGVGGDGGAWGVTSTFGSKHFGHEFAVDSIDRGFSPELGFVRRTGIRTYSADSNYTWRGSGLLRTAQIAVRPSFTTSTGNRTDSWDVPVQWLRLELSTEDRITFSTERSFERVPDFEINDGIIVQGGDYTMTRNFVTLRTSDRRSLVGRFQIETGDFFSGNLTSWSVEPTFIPNRFLRLQAEYEEFRVRLDEGRFTTRVTEGRVDFTPTPDVSWRNLVQYDTDSKDLTVQSRLRWIIEPGNDLFLVAVYGWNRDFHGAPLIPTTQDFTVKLAYTFRF